MKQKRGYVTHLYNSSEIRTPKRNVTEFLAPRSLRELQRYNNKHKSLDNKILNSSFNWLHEKGSTHSSRGIHLKENKCLDSKGTRVLRKPLTKPKTSKTLPSKNLSLTSFKWNSTHLKVEGKHRFLPTPINTPIQHPKALTQPLSYQRRVLAMRVEQEEEIITLSSKA